MRAESCADAGRRRWFGAQCAALLIAAAGLLALFEGSRLDLVLAGHFHDAARGGFPLRQHWLFDQVLHHGLKTVSYACALLALGVCAAGVRGRLPRLPRENAALAAAGMLLIPLLTTLLKHLTNRHCPWDVLDFGGYAPYVGLLAEAPGGIVRGACFPAGHASAGFAWLVWGVALRPAGRGPAALALGAALCAGGLMGWARMAQGAHFLSHVLWSAWLAWAVTVLLAGVLGSRLSPLPAGDEACRRSACPPVPA